MNWLYQSPVHIFFDGAAAVNLFFVLSGFCIAMPYVGNSNLRAMKYCHFLFKRVCRLYPAYIVALGLCLFLKSFYVSPSEDFLSVWGKEFWQWKELSTRQLLNSFFLIATFDAKLLNPPSWSLVVEMRMAFLLPLLILVIQYIKRYELLFLLIVSILSMKISIMGLVIYAPFFIMGVIIAKYREKVMCYINQLTKFKFLLLVSIALVLYSFRFPMEKLFADYGHPLNERIINLIIGVGSSLLIIASFRKSVRAMFKNLMCEFLGKISYSFYLSHFPILLIFCSWHRYFTDNLYVIIFCSFSTTLLVAHFMYKYIEMPFIMCGRKLT